MKKKSRVVSFGLAAFSLGLLFIHCPEVHAGPLSERKKARNLYDDLMAVRKYVAMSNVLEKCQDTPSKDQQELLGLCLKSFDSREKTLFEDKIDGKMHDISLVGGRCAWFASKMLNIELPLVRADTSKKDIAEAKTITLNALRKKRARDLYDDLMGARKYLAMTKVLEKCQDTPPEDQEELLALCLKNLNSREKILFEDKINGKTQDISLVGGRCAWFASRMLNIELPLMKAETSRKDISKAKRMILKALREKRHETFLSEIESVKVELAKKPLGKRKELASNASAASSTLIVLAEDADSVVRSIVASNPKTPLDILNKLASGDKNPTVRKKALENLEKTRAFNPTKKE